MTSLSVIIPVFNGISYTKTALKNLTDLQKGIDPSKLELSIIVVDDGSTDGTHEFVTREYPEYILLLGNGDLWWSGGINLGAEYALNSLHADYLLLWNNDIQPDTDYFSQLTVILGTLDENTIIGSKIYSKDDLIWSMGGLFNPFTGKKKHIAYQVKDSEAYSEIISVDWLPGMGTIVPAGIIRKIGYWDRKNFPQYHGDSDFTWRARLAGFAVKVYPQLKIWNDVSNTGIEHKGNFMMLLRSLKHIKSYNNIRTDLLFYNKYARSPLAYMELVLKYGKLMGGFFKWKILNFLGVNK